MAARCVDGRAAVGVVNAGRMQTRVTRWRAVPSPLMSLRRPLRRACICGDAASLRCRVGCIHSAAAGAAPLTQRRAVPLNIDDCSRVAP